MRGEIKERETYSWKNSSTIYLHIGEFTWDTELRRDETTFYVVFFEESTKDGDYSI